MKSNKAQKHKRSKAGHNLDFAFVPTIDLAASVLAHAEKAYANTAAPHGLGLLPYGAAPGTVTVVLSLPAQGKSTFLMNLALEMQDKKFNAAVFLPEGSAEEFAFKSICARSKTNISGMRRGYLPREQWGFITRAADRFGKPGLFFPRHCPMTAGGVAESATLLAGILKKEGRVLNAVLVDSLNYIKPQEDWLDPLAELRALAKSLDVAVICSYGLLETAAMRQGHIQLGDARLAGLDESHTDQIYYLHRPGFYDLTDPELRGLTTLYRLYPYMALGCNALQLNFSHQTLTFSLIEHPLPE